MRLCVGRGALIIEPLHLGPIGGQGTRPNAQGLNINRDNMKLDTPEARSMVRLVNDFDPHVMIDLHTTNGSRHAYHLTYETPNNPAVAPAIVGQSRDWMATCSICSMSRLKRALRVSIPDLRKLRASVASLRKRAAMRS